MRHEKLVKADLIRARQIAAQIVARFGDDYIPVFRRLLTEVENLNCVQETKGLALKMALEIN